MISAGEQLRAGSEIALVVVHGISDQEPGKPALDVATLLADVGSSLEPGEFVVESDNHRATVKTTTVTSGGQPVRVCDAHWSDLSKAPSGTLGTLFVLVRQLVRLPVIGLSELALATGGGDPTERDVSGTALRMCLYLTAVLTTLVMPSVLAGMAVALAAFNLGSGLGYLLTGALVAGAVGLADWLATREQTLTGYVPAAAAASGAWALGTLATLVAWLVGWVAWPALLMPGIPFLVSLIGWGRRSARHQRESDESARPATHHSSKNQISDWSLVLFGLGTVVFGAVLWFDVPERVPGLAQLAVVFGSACLVATGTFFGLSQWFAHVHHSGAYTIWPFRTGAFVVLTVVGSLGFGLWEVIEHRTIDAGCFAELEQGAQVVDLSGPGDPDRLLSELTPRYLPLAVMLGTPAHVEERGDPRCAGELSLADTLEPVPTEWRTQVCAQMVWRAFETALEASWAWLLPLALFSAALASGRRSRITAVLAVLVPTLGAWCGLYLLFAGLADSATRRPDASEPEGVQIRAVATLQFSEDLTLYQAETARGIALWQGKCSKATASEDHCDPKWGHIALAPFGTTDLLLTLILGVFLVAFVVTTITPMIPGILSDLGLPWPFSSENQARSRLADSRRYSMAAALQALFLSLALCAVVFVTDHPEYYGLATLEESWDLWTHQVDLGDLLAYATDVPGWLISIGVTLVSAAAALLAVSSVVADLVQDSIRFIEPGRPDLGQVTRRLEATLTQLEQDPRIDRICILAHSQGTLMTSALLASETVRHGVPKLERVLFCGSPLYSIFDMLLPRTSQPLLALRDRASSDELRNVYFAADWVGRQIQNPDRPDRGLDHQLDGAGGHTGYFSETQLRPHLCWLLASHPLRRTTRGRR